jgi:hypothetical protein
MAVRPRRPAALRAVASARLHATGAALVASVAAAAVCPNPVLPPVSGVCDATAGDANLLIRGAIVIDGDVLENGHLLIGASGTITCADCDCSAHAGFPTATRVDCPDGVVIPGRIDANEFLNFAQNLPADWGEERYEHRHDWRLGQNGHTAIPSAGGASLAQQRWGELRQLLGGATSVRGATPVAGLVRNLDSTVAATEGLTSPPWSDDNFPLGDASGERLEGSCAYPTLPTAPVGAPYWLTVAEGIDGSARNELVCLSDTGGGAGGVDVIAGAMISDAIAVTAADVAELGAADATVIWSPRSNLALYGRTAPVTQLHRRQVPLALGSDWIVTGSMSMARELACADLYNRRYLAGRLSDRELFDAAAKNAAFAGGMGDEIGVIVQGHRADVVVFGRDGRDPYRAAIEGDVSRLALALRGGRPLIGEDDVLAVWPVAGCADASVELCGRDLRPCLDGEFGLSYAMLAAANAASYPDHFCGQPQGEPLCQPVRALSSGGFPTHDGVPRADDFDGDGFANGVDLCPVVFDPPTVSALAQANADGDAAGDACDFCPTSASATGCGEGVAGDLTLSLWLPPAIGAGSPFPARLVVSTSGGTGGWGRVTLPTLRELVDVAWTCTFTGSGICPSAGSGGLDADVVLPAGSTVTFRIEATHPGPLTAPGEHFVAVASIVPDPELGEIDSLDNYAATASVVLEASIFADGFESGDTGQWSATTP